MRLEIHLIKEHRIVEVLSEDLLIASAEEGLDLLGTLYYQDIDKIILHAGTITPEFFDLKNGLAGEILQKFSNYRVRLAIVGDFTKYASKSLQDFIYESNKGRQVNFVSSLSEAFDRLTVA